MIDCPPGGAIMATVINGELHYYAVTKETLDRWDTESRRRRKKSRSATDRG